MTARSHQEVIVRMQIREPHKNNKQLLLVRMEVWREVEVALFVHSGSGLYPIPEGSRV